MDRPKTNDQPASPVRRREDAGGAGLALADRFAPGAAYHRPARGKLANRDKRQRL